MLNLILGNLAVVFAMFAISASGLMGPNTKQKTLKTFRYRGPSSFVMVPIVCFITSMIIVLPVSFMLMHALGILHIHMPTVFTESYSFYDTLHIDLALTLIITPYTVSHRIGDAAIRKDLGYE
jgi:hypothetical protein